MARARTPRELFLQVSGTVDPLKQNLKGGSSALIEFAGNAERQLEAVEQSLRSLGGGDSAAAAKQLTANYHNAFREIRRNAEQVLSADSGAGALQIINANAARQAASAAENRAAAMRVVADAARAEAVAQGTANTELTQYAAAAIVAAREAEDYANALRAQANTLTAVEGRMGAIVPVGKRITEVSGQARAGMQQLSYQLGDVATQMAAGTPPSIIFAQQIGQVTQAIGLMSGGAKGWLSIIGGPWGIGISSALVVLTPLVAKLFEGNDALEEGVDKLKKDAEQTRISDQARQIFTRTIEGQIEAQRKLNEEIERGLKSQRQLDNKLLGDATQRLAEGEGRLELNRRKLVAAEERLAQIKREAPGANDIEAQEGYQFRLKQAQQTVDGIKSEIAQAETLIADAKRGVAEARIKLAEGRAAELSDASKAIEEQFGRMRDAAIEAAEAAARRGAKIDQEELARRLANIETTKQARLKEQRELEQAGRATRSGKVTPNAVGKLLQDQFGGTVTSTTGGKHVKNSYHYRGQAVDFVPKGGMGSTSKAEIRAYLESQGISIKELLGPGDKDHNDHFHVAFGKTQRSPDQVARSQEAARNRGIGEEISYVNEARQAKKRLLDALESSATTEEARYQLTLEEVNAEADARVKRINLLEQQGKLKAGQAEVLRNTEEATRSALLDSAWTERMRRSAEEAEKNVDAVVEIWQQRRELEGDALRGQIEELRLREGLAVTTADRHRLALEILALEQQARRQALENVRDNSKDKAERDRASAELERLPRIESLEREQVGREFASPLQRYRDQLLETTGDMGDAIEGVAVRSFGALEDASERGVKNLLKLKGAVGDFVASAIADFARLALQRGFLQLLNMVGLGASAAGGVRTGSASGVGLPSFGGARAGGGPVDPSNFYLVGEKGPELFIPGASGMILPNRLPSAPTLQRASAAGGVSTIRLEFDELPMFELRVAEISGGVTATVAKKGAKKGALAQRQSVAGR